MLPKEIVHHTRKKFPEANSNLLNDFGISNPNIKLRLVIIHFIFSDPWNRGNERSRHGQLQEKR